MLKLESVAAFASIAETGSISAAPAVWQYRSPLSANA